MKTTDVKDARALRILPRKADYREWKEPREKRVAVSKAGREET